MRAAFALGAFSLISCGSPAPAAPAPEATPPAQPAAEHRPETSSYLWRMHNRIHPFFGLRVDALPPGHEDASVVLEIFIDAKTGQLVGATVAEPSGFAALDTLALDAIKNAEPFGAPPASSATEDQVRILWRFFRLPQRACSSHFARIAGPTSRAVPFPQAWDECPFPAGADRARVHKADVELVVSVAPDGTPTAVRATSDPGYGFARAAAECAMRQRYLPARSDTGEPIAGETTRFRVWFSR